LGNDNLEFEKIVTKVLDVDIAAFYQPVKSQLNTPCILGHTKNNKIGQFL
jgi:hypothetical protein